MTVLTNDFILKRTKQSSLEEIHNLSLWGTKLTDVTAVKNLPNLQTCAFSVNSISSLQPFAACKKLTELFLRKNCISGLDQLFYLKDLKNLRVLWLSDNPIASTDNYRLFAIAALPQLTKLDQIDITDAERTEAKIMFPDPLAALNDAQNKAKKGPSPRGSARGSERPRSAAATPQQEAALAAIRTLLPFMSASELQSLKTTIQELKKQ